MEALRPNTGAPDQTKFYDNILGTKAGVNNYIICILP